MLRRILNFLVILVIIVAISAIFINLYNSGKKESNKFDTVKEKVKEDATKVKDSVKKKTEEIKKNKDKVVESKDKNEDSNTSTSSDNSKELDDNDVDSSDGSSVTGNEVAVGSTGTKENIYLSLVGGVVVLSGGVLIFKTNLFRA